MARMLGDAFVTIRAETTGFRADAYAQIKKAIAGINPKVPVDLELRDKGKFIAAAEKAVRIQANVDNRKAYQQILELRDRLQALSERVADIPISVDDRGFQARIEALQLKILALAKQLAHLPVGLDTSALIKANSAITALEASTDRLSASSAKAVAAFLAEEEALAKVAEEAVKAAAAQALTQAATDHTASSAARGAVAQNLLNIAMGRGPALYAKATNGLGALGRVGGFLGAAFAVAGAKVTLFGGLLNGLLPAFLTHISVWHIAADVLFELIAVWGGAAIAAGAFGIAASDATQEVIRRMQALHTVADATNQVIPPLTGNLEKLHDAVRPAVYEVFGDTLNIAKARTGDFAKIVHDTAPVVDYLAARMTVAISNGKAFDVFTKNAGNSLLGLGNSFGNVFGAIGNVLTVMPDYAQKLLSFGVVVTGVLENITRMIEPVLRWGLAIHGAFIYIGLATTLGVAFYAKVIVPLAAGLVNAAARAAFFGIQLLAVARAEGIAAAGGALLSRVSPLGWITLAIAGLTALVLWLHHSSDASRDFAQNLVDLADAANITQSLTANLHAQAAVTAELASVQSTLNEVTKLGLQNTFGGQIYYLQLTDKVKVLTGALRILQQQYQTEQSRLQPLVKTYGSTAAALGVLNAAGITTAQITKDQGQAWAIDKAQIDGTIASYQAMTGVAGQMNNNMEVIGRTLTDQYQAVQKLNQGWSTFISDVTSTQGTFDTVAQGFEVLASHSGDLKLTLGKLKATFSDTAGSVALQGKLATATAAVASAQSALAKLQKSGTATSLQLQAAQQRLVGAQDRLTVAQLNLSQAQSGGIAAIDALTPAGIALNQAFTEQIGNIDKLLASWRTAGLANDLFVQGVRDSIAPLVKYAQGSNEATAQLIALAQEAGYHGPISMRELVKWLGNTKNATQDLKDITNQATVQEALLTGAMQAQGAMIANRLIGAINNAILKYNGVEQAATNYGNAIAQTGRQSADAEAKQRILIKSIIAAGKAANDSTNDIAAMISKILGIPLKTAIGIVLEMSGTGSMTIKSPFGTQNISISGQTFGGNGPGSTGPGVAPGHKALGGLITGGVPGRDSVAAMLMPGELVVPTWMVSAGLVNHLSGKLPGFMARGQNSVHAYAGGGIAGRAFMDNSILPAIDQVKRADAKYGSAAMAQFAQKAIAAVQQQGLASSAGGPINLPGGNPSGGAQAYAQSILPAGWSWPALVALWNQESGWNPFAVNPSSGAYGIPQALPAVWDHPYALGDFVSQIRWGLNYIAGRYGSSQAAEAHELAFHWYKQGGLVGSSYDKGGVLPPWGVGVNTSGKAEMVSPASGAGSLHETNMLLRMMIHAVNENTRVTGAQGHQFAHGLGVTAARAANRGYYGG